MKNSIYKKIIFIFGFLFLISIAQPISAAIEVDDVKFTPQIGIPGSEFQQGEAVEVGRVSVKGENKVLTANLISRYVNSFYSWGLSILGILAVLMLMTGGILWLTSRGDNGQIEKAKKMISGSLFGSLLLLGAWFILNTINPDLVKPASIDVVLVNPKIISERNSCGNKVSKETCESESWCVWTNGECLDRVGNCADKKEDTENPTRAVCCCQQANGVYVNCKWGTYYGNPYQNYCISCGDNYTNTSNSYCEGGSPSTNPEENKAELYCEGYWCLRDSIFTKFWSCSQKEDGESCPRDGYCYNHVCWTSDVNGNNVGKINEPCGNEGGKCYESCPDNYERDSWGGRNCEGKLKCCVPEK